jgi:hypothetical protein
MTQLQRLRIYDTAVTEAGLKRVVDLPALEYLEISPDQISADGLDDLVRLRPGLKVVVGSAETDGSGFSRRRRR